MSGVVVGVYITMATASGCPCVGALHGHSVSPPTHRGDGTQYALTNRVEMMGHDRKIVCKATLY